MQDQARVYWLSHRAVFYVIGPQGEAIPLPAQGELLFPDEMQGPKNRKERRKQAAERRRPTG